MAIKDLFNNFFLMEDEEEVESPTERQQRVTQNEENQNRNMQQQPIERTQNNQNHLKLYLKRKYQEITILKKGIIVWDIHQISLIQKRCYYESISWYRL